MFTQGLGKRDVSELRRRTTTRTVSRRDATRQTRTKFGIWGSRFTGRDACCRRSLGSRLVNKTSSCPDVVAQERVAESQALSHEQP